MHFFASADKAKRVLGWKPQHNFTADVPQRLEEYLSSGRLQKDMDFSADDMCIEAAV